MKVATYKESDLERYLAQVRRVAESREAGAERKIRKMYKELAEDLNSWLGNVYAKYAEDDRLDYSILRSKGQYARFLEEVQSKIDGIYPELKSEVENLIDTTYKVCWHGMYNGVTKSKRVEDLKKTFSASKSITPEQIKAAVQNPISKLRLNPVLNRNRQQIISNIRREIGVGLSNGDRMSTMARRIQHYVDNDRSKALLIARTEAHRVREVGFNDSAERIDKIMQDNQSDYRMVKTWRNVGDLAVRKTDKANHVDMEGQTVLADEEFTMVRSRAKAKCPGTSGIAAEDCNCRCRASRDIMNDAEFYAATGRHFPGYKEKSVDNNKKSDKIKSEPQRAEECADYNELFQYYKKTYDVDFDSSVKRLDFESVKEGMHGIELVIDEFPKAKGTLKRISTENSGVMCASYSGTINFNPSYYKDRQSAVNASRSTSGFHPKGNNVVSTASHEMGHLLERTLIEQRNTDSSDLIGKLEWRNCTQAKLVVSEACKAAKKTTDGRGLRNSQLKKGVSGYAATDDSECLAEAVADYIINRDKASVLSRMIWNILKMELG